MSDLDQVYRERAHLVALLASLWPSTRTFSDDAGYSVVYVDSPAGQLSWHIHPADAYLFHHVARTGSAPEQLWDGHSTAEKYRRVASMCYDDRMENQTPSIGRIVHYVSYGTPNGEYAKSCRAAVITEVSGKAIDPATLEPADSWVVGLCVLNPTGQFFNQNVVQREEYHDGGTWHWPERVEA